MKHHRRVTVFVLIGLLLGIAACEQSSPTSTSQSNLIQALSVMPVGAHHVAFTNWASIKRYEGFENVTSASAWDERLEFFRAIIQRHATPSAYGLDALPEHAATWGWDTTDLDWEASVSISLPPGYVLKFRDDFDFAPVLSHLEKRGFTRSPYHEVPVYTHTLDTSLPWVRTTEFSILNTAVLTDAKMLVMSIYLHNVHAMLDAYQNRAASLSDDPAVQAVASRLDDTAAAFISADVCSALSADALLQTPLLQLTADLDLLSKQLRERPPLHDYAALAVGYRYNNAQPAGLIVMYFPDASHAAADLQPRRQLAVEGQIRDRKPKTYSEVYFSLTEALVDNHELLLKVTPLNNNPNRLFALTSRIDLFFATCP